MEPSEKDVLADISKMQLEFSDDILRLTNRVISVEKSTEFCLTVFQLALLACLLYLSYPYLAKLANRDIPGVEV